MYEANEPHDHWGRPINIKKGDKMNLEKSYKEWQENNPDEQHIMVKKKLKPRTIQLWSRKVLAWKNRKLRGEI